MIRRAGRRPPDGIAARVLALLIILAAGCGRNGGDDALRFAVIGDMTVGRDAGTSEQSVFEELVGRMRELDPDFVVVTGDAIEGLIGDSIIIVEQWRRFRAMIEKAGCPVYITPGNHDIWDDTSRRIFTDANKTQTYWSRVTGGVLLISLDTVERDPTEQGEQIDWLCAVLRRYASMRYPVFVFAHYPLIESRLFAHPLKIDGDLRIGLLRELARGDGCFIFSGHVHTFRHISSRPIEQYISGGGGEPMIPSPSAAGRHHFLLCEWRNDSLHVDIVQPHGSVPDGREYREELGVLDLDSLSDALCLQRRDPRAYQSERFAMTFSVPGNVIRLDAGETLNRYVARFMFSDRVSGMGITVARYGKGARAGVMEDVEVFRDEYGKKGYILSTDAEGSIENGSSLDGYWWTGSTDGGKKMKCEYFARNDLIYCFIYSSTDDLYDEHLGAFEEMCSSLVLAERRPAP